MGLCIEFEGEGQGQPGTRRGPGGGRAGPGPGGWGDRAVPPMRQGTAGPKPGRGQNACTHFGCKTFWELNDWPFRHQSKILDARPQIITCSGRALVFDISSRRSIFTSAWRCCVHVTLPGTSRCHVFGCFEGLHYDGHRRPC